MLFVLAGVALVLAFMPNHGAPDFRYTGSDPDHHVWNFGWPLATCIYDSSHSPHFFVGPFAYLFVFLGFGGFTSIYAVFVAWNRCGMLRTTAEMETTH